MHGFLDCLFKEKLIFQSMKSASMRVRNLRSRAINWAFEVAQKTISIVSPFGGNDGTMKMVNAWSLNSEY